MQTRSMTKMEAIPISFEIREIVADYISGAKNKGSARNRNKKMEYPLKELSVDIDFDEASRAWHQNKKKLNDCTYKYICVHCFKNGRKCGKEPLANTNFCKSHVK